MAKQTVLYDVHVAAGGKMVDFAGWDMPLHYGSQIAEHTIVRIKAGMFDVSHMANIELTGAKVTDFLRYLLANDVAKLKTPGKALYSCLLNEQGGIIDDLIVYKLSDTFYRMVVNAGTRDKDLAWITKQAKTFDVSVNERTDFAMLAVQGPQARECVFAALNPAQSAAAQALIVFSGCDIDGWFIGRTGYTGEDGFEILLPKQEAPRFWDNLQKAGVAPCGLGARDTLRLEAGMNLYGTDMDETTTPWESNLTWTVSLTDPNRDFIGKAALLAQQAQGIKRQLVGLVLESRGVLRGHQKVRVPEVGEGEITSGSFSPTLNLSIAFARIPTTTLTQCEVEIRNQWLPARIIAPPFVRSGKKNF